LKQVFCEDDCVLGCCASSLLEFVDVSRMFTASIIRALMELVSTSETSLNFFDTTRPGIPADRHFGFRRSENLKFHVAVILAVVLNGFKNLDCHFD
jgi:hypothetical protein